MKNVLLLNQNFTPLRPISWKKGVGLVLGRGKAEVLEEYVEQHSIYFNAAVIKLTVPSPDPYSLFKKQKFSKKHVFLRDRYTCQYCAKAISVRDGTIDHVLPRSKGGKTDYLNCVAACKPCNSRKDNKTPEQAMMPLLTRMRYPTVKDIFYSVDLPEEWKQYLF